MTIGRLVTASALLLFGTACIMVEADVPHACFQEKGVEIDVPLEELEPEILDELELASAALLSVLGEVVQQPSFDFGDALPVIEHQESFSAEGLSALPETLESVGASGSIRMLSVALDGEAGRFDVIERAALLARVGGEDSGAAPIELAVCDVAQGCDVEGDRLEMVVASDVDLLELLTQDDLDLVLDLAVRPFLETLVVDVEVCMAATAEVSLSL